jgi:hypothetical protein
MTIIQPSRSRKARNEGVRLIPPRSLRENVRYRIAVRRWALKSKANRDWLMKKCAQDFFFFCETFLWIYEPRPEEGKPNVIPFIPWDHQRPAMTVVIENLGFRDIGMEKARGEGASWTCLMIIFWRWLFRDMESFGLVSMNEQAADNPDDPNSLGWKLDWQLKQLPQWMVGKKSTTGRNGDYTRNISKHNWINERNGSTITAYACTGDLASGGRKTAFFMDELSKFPRGPDEESMAATEPVTNSRLLVSTPKGSDGAYYHAMTEDGSMIKLVLDWTKNPTRNQNLFLIDLTTERLLRADIEDEVVEVDKGYQLKFFNEYLPILRRRGFDVEAKGKLWSPWYVERCLRPRMTPKKIAQEYDRDYGGSASRFFPSAVITRHLERALAPKVQGEVICDLDTLVVEKFTTLRNGHLKLWLELRGGTIPPRDEYVLGIDVATGQGGSMSSNSVISIYSRRTMKKVGEFANPNVRPERLAQYAVCLAKWFANEDGGPAYMIWEGNGPGQSFSRFVIDETSFRNFHYRTSQKSVSGKATKEPGWWSNKENKRLLLSNYRHALTDELTENASEIALRETLCYVEDTGGKVVFVSNLNEEDDPANDGENHGDRVIADALAVKGCEELNGGTGSLEVNQEKFSIHNLPVNPPKNSYAGRRKKWLALQKNELDW